jgi:hypothetical protein
MKNFPKKSCIGCIALHGMAYYMFLKPLRSLEEFRKNPHIKIPPKSPCTNFQILGIFNNPIFIPKRISFKFQPSHPSACLAFQPTWPTRPFFLPHRTGRAPPLPPLAPSHNGRHPLLLPRHRAPTVGPPITHPSSIGRSYPSFTPGNGSHEGANYHRHPPFQAALASLSTL